MTIKEYPTEAQEKTLREFDLLRLKIAVEEGERKRQEALQVIDRLGLWQNMRIGGSNR